LAAKENAGKGYSVQKTLNKREMLANLSRGLKEVFFCQKAKYGCALSTELNIFVLSLARMDGREVPAQFIHAESLESIPAGFPYCRQAYTRHPQLILLPSGIFLHFQNV